MSSAFSPARRQLFRGDVGARQLPLRPPWSVAEAAFIEGCTRCGDCIRACPEQILRAGSGGFPEVDFGRGECTFCGDCADACRAPVFDPGQSPPWTVKARIETHCITHQKVVCRSCEEQCEPLAIRFTPVAGAVATPRVDLDRCTGCGACRSVCPAEAITLSTPGAGD